jgi:tetratricopeptide (TPR) repeat protein
VHHSLAKLTLGLVAAATTATTGAWAYPSPAPEPSPEPQAAQQESPYKDQGEYDLATAAGKETDAQKKLDKLKEWEQKYPDSKLKSTRTVMQAQAYLGLAMAAYGKTTPPELLDSGQKAAQTIVDNLDNYFSPSAKPAGATDEQWAAARHTFELQAHSVLGWVAMARKEAPKAEEEFKKVLALDPNAAQVSYWLGSVIISQKNVARYSEALYDIARSLVVTGAEALPPAAAGPYGDYLKRAYVGYHGDDSGLEDLKKLAAGSALPPAGFHVDSVAELETKKFGDIEAFNKAHPDVALWRQIRDTLKSDQGDTYFGTVKGSQIPPPEVGFFKAKVVTVNDKDLVVNVDNAGGDATLKFEKAVNAKAINPGDALEFKAVVDSFVKEPYMLTLTIDDPKESIKGLPDNAFSAAPSTKKAGPKKVAPKTVKKK